MEHQMELRRAPPMLFQAARWLQSRRVRGAHRLETYARIRGWFDVVVRYRLGPRAALDVPLRRRPYGYTDIYSYERSAISFMSAVIRRVEVPITLLDCGADIGLISARLVAGCPQIHRVIAFEPNRSIYRTLAGNMALLDVEAQAENAAVSDFVGRGTLGYPPHSGHDHAAFLVPSESGDVAVTTIDNQRVPPDHGIALKIDVEGGEAAVLRGAMNTLARAPWFIVAFEAHRLQSEREGVEPVDLIRQLLGARPCAVYAVRSSDTAFAERPRAIRLDLPFFEQFAANVYNIIAVSQ